MAFCTCSTWYAGRARTSSIAKGISVSMLQKAFRVIALTLSRFWWRDTRLAELVQSPSSTFQFIANSSASLTTSTTLLSSRSGAESRYSFPYPATFLPVPYYSSITLAELDTQIIPAARSVRTVSITPPAPKAATNAPADTGGMESEPIFEAPNITPPRASMPVATVKPDGLLLSICTWQKQVMSRERAR